MHKIRLADGEIEFFRTFQDFLELVDEHMGDDAVDYIEEYVDGLQKEINELEDEKIDMENLIEHLQRKK